MCQVDPEKKLIDKTKAEATETKSEATTDSKEKTEVQEASAEEPEVKSEPTPAPSRWRKVVDGGSGFWRSSTTAVSNKYAHKTTNAQSGLKVMLSNGHSNWCSDCFSERLAGSIFTNLRIHKVKLTLSGYFLWKKLNHEWWLLVIWLIEHVWRYTEQRLLARQFLALPRLQERRQPTPQTGPKLQFRRHSPPSCNWQKRQGLFKLF